MKLKLLLLTISFSTFINSNAQVGIGTTAPQAALDVSHSSQGFLPPRVALFATNIASPVVNPNGGALPAGTVVYNTNTTSGSFAVFPGIYFWDGNNWVSMIKRAFKKEFTQSSILYTTTAAGFENIPGLTNVNFIAPEDGVYQIIAHGYYGVDEANQTSGKDEVGWGEGIFRLTVNGFNSYKYQHSESFHNNALNSDWYWLYNESTIIYYVTLTAGQTCNMSLSFDESAIANLRLGGGGIIGNNVGFALANPCYITAVFIGN